MKRSYFWDLENIAWSILIVMSLTAFGMLIIPQDIKKEVPQKYIILECREKK